MKRRAYQSGNQETEIKFIIQNLKDVAKKLRAAGLRLKTRRTREMNTLYDATGAGLRKHGETLRIRKFGDKWTITHKGKRSAGKHKSRQETETKVEDGRKLSAILECLGFHPVFRYEKFRTEWTDGRGDVVIDETPIGNFGEIEGTAKWIDATANKIGIASAEYNTKSYPELFREWKRKTKSRANNMLWQETKE